MERASLTRISTSSQQLKQKRNIDINVVLTFGRFLGRRLFRRCRHLNRFRRGQRRYGVLVDDTVDAGDDVESVFYVEEVAVLAKRYSDVVELE